LGEEGDGSAALRVGPIGGSNGEEKQREGPEEVFECNEFHGFLGG